MASPVPAANSNAIARKTQALLFRTKLCVFYKKGMCNKGDACGYAHKLEEQRTKPELYRTKMCPDMEKNGTCTRERCRYAHNDKEMRFVRGVRASDHPQAAAVGSYSGADEYSKALQGKLSENKRSVAVPVSTGTDESMPLFPVKTIRIDSALDLGNDHAPKFAQSAPLARMSRASTRARTESTMDSETGYTSPFAHGYTRSSKESSNLPTLLQLRSASKESDGFEEVVVCSKNTFVNLEPAADPFVQVRRTRSMPSKA